MDYFLTEQSLEEDRNITLNGTQDDPDLPVRKILIILIFCLLILVTFVSSLHYIEQRLKIFFDKTITALPQKSLRSKIIK